MVADGVATELSVEGAGPPNLIGIPGDQVPAVTLASPAALRTGLGIFLPAGVCGAANIGAVVDAGKRFAAEEFDGGCCCEGGGIDCGGIVVGLMDGTTCCGEE